MAPEVGLEDLLLLFSKENNTISANEIKLFIHYPGKFLDHHFSIYSEFLLHVLLHTFGFLKPIIS
jgi:hypothetical protein